ncbi:Uncharacterized conserved protein YdeI, YjbR/CyaY-like superfamily, DUF1801 family [Catalinimonas alkaloidigena]|uniref:Uncharacterized conserved protein YdeI, YjbR/CyaY-like superfamily, DUF1801 family n=1 Tax=Catalinimonas alkaloidigena TaxID=1075417 RepID=A0A1G9GCI8_9BACT|nr:YdeI/OmpD-associated family protein [Catalinimonas alkaloidigena]SDK98337.1 Uncharacterized conserved protein YdeI, YjbR/CyaY-like superfamily, DUF1801 family [Catalinimonas alkaloidigena]
MNPKVDHYLAEGCGRCPLGGTPDCKIHAWSAALAQLRALLLDCGLTETLKWGVPCYTFQSRNLVMIHAFKDYFALNFFQGALLHDPEGLLVQQTENVQAGRQIRFTHAREVTAREATLRAYVYEAIEVERAGLKVVMKKTSEFAVPAEFQQQLDQDPALQAAFERLTPGRQRGYLLHFAQPKQAKTRAARVEKYRSHILRGKGLHDR